MKVLNICIRKVKHGHFKGSIDIVLLDFKDDLYGHRFECFGNVGQRGSGECHSSGDYEYFRDKTIKANESEYRCALDSLKSIYDDFEIVISDRLTKKFINTEA